MRLVALEERALGGEIDQLHPATLESERGEFRLGDFHEYVDEGITEAAELEWFHVMSEWCEWPAGPRTNRGASG